MEELGETIENTQSSYFIIQCVNHMPNTFTHKQALSHHNWFQIVDILYDWLNPLAFPLRHCSRNHIIYMIIPIIINIHPATHSDSDMYFYNKKININCFLRDNLRPTKRSFRVFCLVWPELWVPFGFRASGLCVCGYLLGADRVARSIRYSNA